MPFTTGMRVPVNGLTQRSGWLLRGPAGWGEWSPLPSWTDADRARGRLAAIEAAESPFPAPRSDFVLVSMMVPRVAPPAAAQLALLGGCSSVKVQVGDPEGEERVAAVRDAVGTGVTIRLVVHSPWAEDEAVHWLQRFAQYDIEYIQDPVAGLDALASLRRHVAIPVAVGVGVDTPADAARVRVGAAADLLVVKPQRVGGIAATLAIADAACMPVVVSSSIETSVGLCAVAAAAAALPVSPYAHGVGTAVLFADDIVANPLLPVAGRLAVGRREDPLPNVLARAAHQPTGEPTPC